MADERICPEQFSDPVARLLLTQAECDLVDQARAAHTADSGPQRLALAGLVHCAELMVPRTIMIDEALTDAIAAAPSMQLAIVGAGLDSRAWRMPELAGRTVFSLDHPASQGALIERSSTLPAPQCDLRLVPVDLTSQELGSALAGSGHDPAVPTLWLWEGVIPYLDRTQVRATLHAMSRLSCQGSRLIAQYQRRSIATRAGRHASSLIARATGQPTVLADEPWKSLWSAQQLADEAVLRGWSVTGDEGVLGRALAIGSPTQSSWSLRSGRVLVADR